MISGNQARCGQHTADLKIHDILPLIENNGLLLFLAGPTIADLLLPTGYGFQYHFTSYFTPYLLTCYTVYA